MKNKKWLTATNIIVFICILIYILDRFIFVNSITEVDEFSLIIAGKEMGQNPVFLKILGLIFGKLYYFMAIPPSSVAPTQFWQPFTYMFMHQMLPHLIVNILALYIVGNKVEKEKGTLFTILTYIITGIVGVFIANSLVVDEAYTAGSSIAVFGIIGSALGILITNKNFIKNFKKSSIIYLILYGLIFTYTSGNWTVVAHNIGLIFGIIIYMFYHYVVENKEK